MKVILFTLEKPLLIIFLIMQLNVFGQKGNDPCDPILLQTGTSTISKNYNLNQFTDSGHSTENCGKAYNGTGVFFDDLWVQYYPKSEGIILELLSNEDLAFSLYYGDCNFLLPVDCITDYKCGQSNLPKALINNLIPGQSYLIRIWNEDNTGGSFELKLTDLAAMEFDISGSATKISDNCYTLTPALNGQVGCVLAKYPVSFDVNFTVDFPLYFGRKNGGADGISIIFQTNPQSYCAGTGGSLGYVDIPETLVVEFDTWYNSQKGDKSTADHVAIVVDGDIANPIDYKELPNIEDDQYHLCSVIWIAEENRLKVYFDNNLEINLVIDLVPNVFPQDVDIYWGAIATTGGANNYQSFCFENLEIDNKTTKYKTIREYLCVGDIYWFENDPISQAGTYEKLFVAKNGCDSIVTLVLLEDDVKIPQVKSPIYFACNQDEITIDLGLSINTTMTSNWNTQDGNIVSEDGSKVIVNKEGKYRFDVFNNLSSCQDNIEIEVIKPELLDISISNTNQLDCANKQLELQGNINSGMDTSLVIYWSTVNGEIIDNGQTLNPTIDKPGTYILIVENTNTNCSDTASIDVSLFNKIDVQPNNVMDLNCNNLTSQLSFNDGGLVKYSASWYQGSTLLHRGQEKQYDVSEKGQYKVIVFDSLSQCSDTLLFNVLENIENPEVEAGDPKTINCEEDFVTLNGQIQGNINDFDVVWIYGESVIESNIFDVEVKQPGTYSFQVTNKVNGCVKTDDVVVFADQNSPNIDYIVPVPSSCTDNLVLIDASTSDSGSNFEFEWTTIDGVFYDGQNTLTPTVKGAGNYSLKITNLNTSCTNTVEIIVEADVLPPVSSISPPEILNCNNPKIILDGTGSSSGSNINYLWLDDKGNTISYEIKDTITKKGNYKLITQNTANGCSDTAAVTVIEDMEIPIVNVKFSGILNCENTEIELDVSNSSKGNDFEYFWTLNGDQININNDVNPIISEAGNYELIIKSVQNGCMDNFIFKVEENLSTPEFEIISPKKLDCEHQQTEIKINNTSVSSNLIFNWETNTGIINTPANKESIFVSSPGTYILTVKDVESGCVAMKSVKVESDGLLPIADAGKDGALNCKNTQLTIGGANSSTGPNIIYSWTTDIGNIIGNPNQQNIIIDSAGYYFLEVNDTENKCIAFDTIYIGENYDAPKAIIKDVPVLNCKFDSILLDGTLSSQGNNIEYLWSTLGGDFLSEVDNHSVYVSQPGLYQFIVKNSDNECTQTVGVEVEQSIEKPNLVIDDPKELNCKNPSFEMNSLGTSTGSNFEYSWYFEGIKIASTEIINIDKFGDYSFKVTNTENYCDTVQSFSVIADFQSPDANAGSTFELDCNTPESTLNATGAVGATINYLWSTETGNIVSGENSLTPIINTAGDYYLTVFNTQNGCDSVSVVTILENKDNPDFVLIEPLELNCKDSIVDIMSNVSSPLGNLEFEWEDNSGIIGSSTQKNVIVDKPGEYFLTVFNIDNNCSSQKSIWVNQDIEVPNLEIEPPLELNCTVEEAFLDLTVSNIKDGAYSVKWKDMFGVTIPNNFSEDLVVVEPGVYVVNVTNSKNFCEETLMVEVEENTDRPEFFIDSINQPFCKGEKGSFKITNVEGGAKPLFLTINKGESFDVTKEFSKLDAGSYEVLITDANGCTLKDSFTIIEPAEIGVESLPQLELEYNSTGQAKIHIINFEESDIQNISWVPEKNLSCSDCLNPIITGKEKTTYSVTIETTKGCFLNTLLEVIVKIKDKVYVPNVLSSFNSDGINDDFVVFSQAGIVNINLLRIYDRWGELVFEKSNFSPNQNVGWNGKIRNEKGHHGVYTYYVEAERVDGSILLLKGDVTVF